MASRGYDYIICDRWIPDIMIDLSVKTGRIDFVDSRWGKRFLKIIPEHCSCYVIFRDKADILACRQENRDDLDFEFRYQLYTKLEKACYEIPIDNSGTIDNSVKQILCTLYGLKE